MSTYFIKIVHFHNPKNKFYEGVHINKPLPSPHDPTIFQ